MVVPQNPRRWCTGRPGAGGGREAGPALCLCGGSEQPGLLHQERKKMVFQSKVNRQRNRLTVALGAAALLGLFLGPAHAQQRDPMDELLDKLKAKGVLSDDEYQ